MTPQIRTVILLLQAWFVSFDGTGPYFAEAYLSLGVAGTSGRNAFGGGEVLNIRRSYSLPYVFSLPLWCFSAFCSYHSRPFYDMTYHRPVTEGNPHATHRGRRRPLPALRMRNDKNHNENNLYEPSETEATFGRKSYWNEVYGRKRTNRDGKSNQSKKTSNVPLGLDSKIDESFAWYCTWEDLEPFWDEFVLPMAKTRDKTKILVAGVGNDPCIVSMYDAGWTNLCAYDYSSEGVALCQELLAAERLAQPHGTGTACVCVADARNLNQEYDRDQFDVIFEKGTLDAIYLSGGMTSSGNNFKDQVARRQEQLNLAICEMHRVLKPGGIVFSVASVAIDPMYQLFSSHPSCKDEEDREKSGVNCSWELLRDGRTIYMTESGFASNNVDATISAWMKDT